MRLELLDAWCCEFGERSVLLICAVCSYCNCSQVVVSCMCYDAHKPFLQTNQRRSGLQPIEEGVQNRVREPFPAEESCKVAPQKGGANLVPKRFPKSSRTLLSFALPGRLLSSAYHELPSYQKRQTTPTPSLRPKLKPKTNITSSRNKTFFPWNLAEKKEIETKNQNHDNRLVWP